MRSDKLPIAALLCAALIWGATFSLVKKALLDVDALSFLGFRFVVALVSFAVVVVWLPNRRVLVEMTSRQWGMGIATGTALYGGFVFQTLGLRFTSAANSAFITGLCVIMVPFLMWAGGAPPRRKHAAGALISAAGLFWITGADIAEVGQGDLFTLVCAFFFALHIICLGVFGKRVNVLGLFAVQLLVAAILAVGAAVFWGGPVRWSAEVVLALGVTGIFATSAAFFLQTWAQSRLEPVRASIWILAEPLFALGFGVVILGEFPAYLGLVGAAIIFLGVIVAEVGDRLAPRLLNV
ncbi:MAG: DMT family transporter [Nitrospinaceae bacterium]|nr:DMT family transporter [Nitrospinaceae bacterium]MBT3434343.1 DMT family transporter [Nitrospinaceae bacterium]MBT3821701.1 DMT family transporter [Nitrospinaceae bacterium]MBT4432231.1 DMT family transporter [Nitrospinaceae bacterium]MBT5368444.1 DMT family transporter [Nitrospinaceae bacterium]